MSKENAEEVVQIQELAQMQELAYSLLNGTSFFSYVRNKLTSSNILVYEIKQIISDNYTILRARKSSHMDREEIKNNKRVNQQNIYYEQNNPFCTIKIQNPLAIVVIYGTIIVNQKKYQRGSYLFIDDAKNQQQIQFVKSSTLILINSEILEHRLVNLNDLLDKYQSINCCLPTIKMKLSNRDMRKLAAAMNKQTVKYGQVLVPKKMQDNQKNSGEGIFLLLKGIFQVCYLLNEPNDKRVKANYFPVYELQNNFCVIDSKMASRYQLKIKSSNGQFGYIPLQSLMDLDNGEEIMKSLMKIQNQRDYIKNNIKISSQYQKSSQKNRKYFMKHLKQCANKTMLSERNNKMKLSKSSTLFLTKSNVTMPQSEGTQKFKNMGDTVQTMRTSRYYSQQKARGWSTRQHQMGDNMEKFNLQKNYQRTLDTSMSKLARMKKYESLKGFKTTKDLLFVNSQKLEYATENTFYHLKNNISKVQKDLYYTLKRKFTIDTSIALRLKKYKK